MDGWTIGSLSITTKGLHTLIARQASCLVQLFTFFLFFRVCVCVFYRYRWVKNGFDFLWQSYDDRISQQPGRGTLVITTPRDEDIGQSSFCVWPFAPDEIQFTDGGVLLILMQGNINVSHPTSGERPHRIRFLSESRISIRSRMNRRWRSRRRRVRLSVCAVSHLTAGRNRPSTGWCRTATEPCAASIRPGWRSIPKARSGSPTWRAKTPAMTLSTPVQPHLFSGKDLPLVQTRDNYPL